MCGFIIRIAVDFIREREWRKEGVRINGIVPITTATTAITILWRKKVIVERFLYWYLKSIGFAFRAVISEDVDCFMFLFWACISLHMCVWVYVWIALPIESEKKRKQERE